MKPCGSSLSKKLTAPLSLCQRYIMSEEMLSAVSWPDGLLSFGPGTWASEEQESQHEIDMGVFEKAGGLLWQSWSSALERFFHETQGRKKCCPACLWGQKENSEEKDLKQRRMNWHYDLGLGKIEHPKGTHILVLPCISANLTPCSAAPCLELWVSL